MGTRLRQAHTFHPGVVKTTHSVSTFRGYGDAIQFCPHILQPVSIFRYLFQLIIFIDMPPIWGYIGRQSKSMETSHEKNKNNR